MVGSRLSSLLPYLLPLPLVLAAVLAGSVAALKPQATARADCAFPFTPTSYEDLKNRRLFLDTIELAAHNMLFPGDPYFGLPPIEVGPRHDRVPQTGIVPPVLLKAIAWIESSITQAAMDVPFGSVGPALISFDCGHGVAQVTTGMTIPTGENGRGSPEQALVATHFAYNIARGAWILVDKWNEAPEMKPIAGSDTHGHPAILENWYYAVWAYNGFTGPGANRSNHPMDPLYGSWPRPSYSCGPTSDEKGHNRGNYPYQELVYGCIEDPPVVDGEPLWEAQAVTLPDLNDSDWGDPLDLDNFVFPYVKMDIPSPQPFHTDNSPVPDPTLRNGILGQPQMSLSKSHVIVGLTEENLATTEVIEIGNPGTGILSWYAASAEPWIVLTPYTGVAVGSDLPCEPEAPCERQGKMQITLDVEKMPPDATTATVTVQGLGINQAQTFEVEVVRVMQVGAAGVAKN